MLAAAGAYNDEYAMMHGGAMQTMACCSVGGGAGACGAVPVVMPPWAMGGVLVAVAVDAAAQYHCGNDGSWGYMPPQATSLSPCLPALTADPGFVAPQQMLQGFVPVPVTAAGLESQVSPQMLQGFVPATAAELESQVMQAPLLPGGPPQPSSPLATLTAEPDIGSQSAPSLGPAAPGPPGAAKIFMHGSDGALRHVASAKAKEQAGRAGLEVNLLNGGSPPGPALQGCSPPAKSALSRSTAAPKPSQELPQRSASQALTAQPTPRPPARNKVRWADQVQAWHKVPAPRRGKANAASVGSPAPTASAAGDIAAAPPAAERAGAAERAMAKGPAPAPLSRGGVADDQRSAVRTVAGSSCPAGAQGAQPLTPAPMPAPQPAEASCAAEANCGANRLLGRGKGKARSKCVGEACKAVTKSLAKDSQEGKVEDPTPVPADRCSSSRIGIGFVHWREVWAPFACAFRCARSRLLVAAARLAEPSGVSPRGVLAALLLCVATVACVLVVVVVLLVGLQLPSASAFGMTGCQRAGAMASGIACAGRSAQALPVTIDTEALDASISLGAVA